MTRIRKWLLVAAVVLSLLLPFGQVASAAPGGNGGGAPTVQTTSSDPGDGGGFGH